jgi:hypothetical protein
LGGRWVAVARTVDGPDVPLRVYEAFADDLLRQVVL